MSSYYGVNAYFKDRFGCKVYKLALDGGFSCPNRDGTVGSGGCIFCLNGSGEFAEKTANSIDEQIERAKERIAAKVDGNTKYIAYFQAYTNTYAPVERLRALYMPITERGDIAAISIATRPDCLGAEVLDFLEELNRKKPLFVELGLQTIHKPTADYIRRGYDLECYNTSAEALNRRGIELISHVILGLPHETEEMMLETVAHACKYSKGIKLQLLHVLEGTDLAEDYRQGKFKTLELDQYARLVKKCIDIIPKDIVIHRLTGDGAKKHLIAPLWSGDKKQVINRLNRELVAKK